MKFIQQKDMMDCGSACLAMIANHYGMPIIKQKEEHSTL
ncbi:cysteine peptidase family C39 domain-containing protein [uncultured Porphyromonas sp.]|nr:cysteine peptidase family C39 domain-containing protein [uncultured Porphyromonas sp.]